MSADEQPTAPGGPPAPGAPPGAPPAAGRLIGGYLLEELAGAGGMGVVYRARERALGRAVALKLIAPQYARDPGFRALFVQESLAAAALEHPNVVPIYRAGEDQGELFIAMRYVEGQSLYELIAAHGRLEPALVGRILVQAAAALDAAHAHGLVHRDVKPANILIAGEEGQERVYLTDFGLSALAGTGLGALGGRVTGTLGYLAPEQIRGGPLDARTDVYALGCVLSHALTGELPFPAREPAQALIAHLSAPPPRPRALRPELPAGFDALIARALAKRPAERFQSAGELAAAAAGLGFDVFLCHGPTEREAAAALAERLLGRGLEPWWAAGRIGPDADPARAEREGLRGSACCAVLVGPDGLGTWAREELALAEQLGLPLVSVLTPGAPEPFDPRLSFLAGRPWVDLRAGLDDQKGLQGLLHAIRRGQPAGAPAPAGAEAVCPYRGLEPFGEADAAFFVGREEETELLVERLRAGRVVCVLGPSGSGKSSLLRAGLVPALKGGALAGSERWRYLSLRPGARPLEALCAALSGVVPEQTDGLTPQALRADPAALDSWLSAAMADRPPEERALVVVDQLEELFALCAERAERRAFLEALRYGAAIPGGRLAALVCMRSDFYHRLGEHPPLHELAAAHQQLVGPLDQEHLRRAIEEPAARAGLELEPGLTEAMLEDLAERPGALPLLQHLLLELWQRRRGAELTLEAYAASGGVQGALGARAEALFQALEEPERLVARRALLRLVVPGEGAEDTRRRAERRELAGEDADEPLLERVLGALAAARLLSLGRDEASGEPTVELAHEALIRGWPRLSGWIAEEREQLRAQARLAEGAREWEQAGRDEALLLRGARLAGWAERGEEGLSALEREFLAQSRDRAERERRARGRRLRLAFGGLGGGLLALGAVAGVALWQRGVANDRERVAVSRELATSASTQLGTDPELALLLALRAYGSSPTPQAEEALRQATHDTLVRTVIQVRGAVPAGVAFSPTGDRLLTWASGRGVQVWGLPGGHQILSLGRRSGYLNAAAFSPDGRKLIVFRTPYGRHDTLPLRGPGAPVTRWDARSGRFLGNLGYDYIQFSRDGRYLAGVKASTGVISIIDRRRGQQVRRIGLPPSFQGYGTFSVDDSRYALCGQDGVLRVWHLARSPRARLWRGCPGTDQMALDARGAHLAGIGRDGRLRLWRLDPRRRDLTLLGRRPGSYSDGVGVTFTPDGRVVYGSNDGPISVWNYGGETRILRGHNGESDWVAVRPDGRQIASSGADGTVRVWDISSGHRLLAHQQGPLTTATFDQSGRVLTTADAAGAVRVWELGQSARPVSVLRGPGSLARWAAVSAKGDRLATVGTDNRVRIWDGRGRRTVAGFGRVGPVGDHPVALSRDGDDVAAIGNDRIHVWTLRGRAPTVPRSLRGVGGAATSLSFSPDGRLLAAGNRFDGVYVWRLSSGAAPRILASGGSPDYSVDVGPGGRLIAAGAGDGKVRVWELASGHAIAVLSGHQGPVRSVRFSGDGRLLVSAGQDGTVRVWDWRQAAELVVLRDPAGPLLAVQFASGDRRIVGAAQDGTISSWSCDVCGPMPDVLRLAKQRVVRALTPEEQRQFIDRTRASTAT